MRPFPAFPHFCQLAPCIQCFSCSIKRESAVNIRHHPLPRQRSQSFLVVHAEPGQRPADAERAQISRYLAVLHSLSLAIASEAYTFTSSMSSGYSERLLRAHLTHVPISIIPV